MTAIKLETCRLATQKIEMSDESARSGGQNEQICNTKKNEPQTS